MEWRAEGGDGRDGEEGEERVVDVDVGIVQVDYCSDMQQCATSPGGGGDGVWLAGRRHVTAMA